MTTDKFALGYFKEIYSPVFGPISDRILRVLEIGVAFGYSLQEWEKMFPNAKIDGVDINHVPLDVENSRISLHIRNAYTESTVKYFMDISPVGYDLIIDDGSHSVEHQKFFLQNYLKLLKPNGTAVLEDVIDMNRRNEIIASIDKNNYEFHEVIMEGKQLDDNLKAQWKNGLRVFLIHPKSPKSRSVAIEPRSIASSPPKCP